MSSIDLLQDWYRLNCNGDWEHEYGIKIYTLDNPGWGISIDLRRTALEGFEYFFSKREASNDWIDIKTQNNEFIAYGDPGKLEKLIEIFLYEFLKKRLKESDFIYEIYAQLPGFNIWKPLEAKMVDINRFEIVEIPKSEWIDLKALKVEDFEYVDKNQCLSLEIEFKVFDIVKCDLIKFFDHPALIVVDKLS